MELFDREEMMKIVTKIVSGLCHIHKQGVIHLDLSKDNIFIDSKRVAKIADFGLAVFLRDGEADAECSYLGNALYRAPEIYGWAEGEKIKVNAKVDMYVLGLIIFEMAYRMDTKMERTSVFKEMRNGNFEDLELNSHILGLVTQLLDLDQSKRPSAMELLEAL
ncbi:hypothetical protein OROGR_011350 [Orobanche gracilis]